MSGEEMMVRWHTLSYSTNFFIMGIQHAISNLLPLYSI